MKRLILICLLVVSMAALAPTVKADNPANWHFSLVTDGNSNDDGPLSPSVDTGYPQYEYQWELTHEAGPWPALQVVGLWFDIWGKIKPGDKNGSGTFGPLPTEDMLVLHIDYPEIKADFYAWIDSGGYGYIGIRNVDFGLSEGYHVTGARFTGNVTVIPEPATMALLGLGALSLITRKK